MIKNNKAKAILSSLIILLPIIAGWILWDRLPEQIAIHWNLGGVADGFSSRAVAVFAMPSFLLVLHWLCLIVTGLDPKNKRQSKKVLALVFWICPILSVFVSSAVYASAMGLRIRMEIAAIKLVGLLFVVLGNYLLKCRQNHTIGIKIKWTLEDEENWNKTHRLAGWLWTLGGWLLFVAAWLPKTVLPYVLIGILMAMTVMPIIYSYYLYKKKRV